MSSVDVAVVGGGAGGLAAAFQARRRGASVCVIEADRLGGDCTWTGCVPSKALLERAREVHAARRAGWDGAADVPQIMRGVAETVERIARDEDADTLERHGVMVARGRARFTGPRTLEVEGTAIAARTVIIATGAAPLVPEGWTTGAPLTTDTVFGLRTAPRRLAVVGGGATGVELAQAFQRLGSAVTLLEADRLLPAEEPEAGSALERVLRAEGVEVRIGTPVNALRRCEGTVQLELADGDVSADDVLVALGRRPATADLGLGRAGVATDGRGFVTVDGRLRATASGVYAVGDVTGLLPFTHAADEMGRTAVDDALGRVPRRFRAEAVPWATFTDPEIGRVGLTEAQAFARYGAAARVALLPLRRIDRARVTGRVDGFVKLVTGPRRPLGHAGGGRLLGATVMCPAAGDVIHEAAVVMRAGAFAGRLAQTVHAYPSWALGVRQAAALLFDPRGARAARPGRQG